MPIEYLIRDSDNLIKLTLTEDDVAISGAWSALDIDIGGVMIHRTADGDGVALDTSTGILTLSPGDLTADEKAALAELSTQKHHRGRIVLTTTLNDDGVVFGGAGSEPLFFHISDKP
jgi:hypothetical protein